ncbi:hypothetical protein DCO48_05895 [Pseudomonas sp. SDI]|uniref:DUF4376 domain-containing protein n=1 Tax=Pseudomonas sp. SDI TaxID=2170734 RepID=UPI000DE60F71|nr:hypothetical protein [Pseudomonas sp. SDI]PWB34673.1 hypothetical protein DCO48_05895 [Pseudomonas sp. SDI]
MFATWIEKDQRFGFRLSEGVHEIGEEEHTRLLTAETLGMRLVPDPATGRPIAVPAVGPGIEPAEALKKLHQQTVAEIKRQCEATITGGFWSNALGERHRYNSQQEDQLNLTGAVLRGEPMAFPCRDLWLVKAYRMHTAEQLRKVSDEFTLFKMQLLQRADEQCQLADEALAEGDMVTLESLRWEAPAS